MLVKVRSGGALSGAEREFVDAVRAIPVTCLAALDVQVGGNGTRRVDAVLFTPRGITVLAVKGFRRRQSGILDLSDDGPWTISDSPLDLDEQPGADPVAQLEQSVFVVRSALERSLQDAGHVCGAVLLVPYRGVVVRPARTSLRPGLDVVVANVPDSTELRIYVENFSAASRDWTADRVVAATRALGLDPPSRAELIADGFAAATPPPIAAVLPEYRPKPKPVPGPASRGQSIGGWAVLAVALIGVVVVLGVVVTAWIADTDGPGERATQTTTAEPTTPASRPQNCFPFQIDC
ncbi:nuclease-related domain-containing protein [Nocardia takedensis]